MANKTNNDIARAIWETCVGKQGTELETTTKKVAKFLARKRLLSNSKQILSTLQKIENEKNGIISVVLKSANKVDVLTQKQIADLLKKKYNKEKVVFEEKIIPDLLGGFRIEVGDEVIDVTLHNRLAKMKLELSR